MAEGAKTFALSLLAPRSRLKVLNSVFAEDLVSLLPTQPTISQVKSPPQDWLDSDLLAIEVPMLEFGKEEVHLPLQRVALKLKSLGVKLLLIVTPRGHSGKWGPTPAGKHAAERPIRSWNEWLCCPFQLEPVCSCSSGRGGGLLAEAAEIHVP